jgi:hypothetical protein
MFLESGDASRSACQATDPVPQVSHCPSISVPHTWSCLSHDGPDVMVKRWVWSVDERRKSAPTALLSSPPKFSAVTEIFLCNAMGSQLPHVGWKSGMVLR